MDLSQFVSELLPRLDNKRVEMKAMLSQSLGTSSRLVRRLNTAHNLSTTFETLSSTGETVFSKAHEQLYFEESMQENAVALLSRLSWIEQRLSATLQQLNRSVVEMEELTLTQLRDTEKDTMKEMVELGKVRSGVELLLISSDRITCDASVSNTRMSELAQNMSQLLAESSQIVAEYEVFTERLQSLQAGADAAILHALTLSQQVHSILELGERFLSSEYVDEFARLSLVNTTASLAVLAVSGSNGQLVAHMVLGELLRSAALEETISKGRFLVETAHNTTSPSLAELESQLWRGTLQYDRVHESFQETVQQVASLEMKGVAIERELSEIMERVSNVQSSSERINGTMRVFSSLIDGIDLESIVNEVNRTTSDATDSLNSITANYSELANDQTQLQANLLDISQSVQESSTVHLSLNNSLSQMASLVSATYNIIDQADHPLWFGGETSVLTLSPEQLRSPLLSGEFRSLSLHFSPSTLNSSLILHLISTGREQARTELLVEVSGGHLRVLFRTVSARGRVFSLPLTLSDRELEAQETYSVFISRTSVNVHVELTDLSSEGGEVHMDRETSTRLSSAFSSSSFLSTAALHIGGGSPLLQDGLRYCGCLGGLEINSYHLNLWSLAFDSGYTNLRPCTTGNYSVSAGGGKVLLQLGEGRFSHQWVNGTFLPVVVEFQTLLPNGLLLYTHSSPSSESVVNSLSVYLELGRLEVKVRAGDRQRTLTSTHTYTNGVRHVVKIDLEGSSRLVMRTEREVVRKRLQMVPVGSLSTYSELLVGGAGEGVRGREEIGQSNFTGCVSVHSLGSQLTVPRCYQMETINCTYCSSHEVALSADFYGASYAVFPTFTATAHFDISLSFRTYFGDGLMLFVGSAAQSMWLALVLEGGRFTLLFQAGSNSPFSLSRGGNLNDSSLHTVTIIRSGFSLSMVVDDVVYESPFGFGIFFPSGHFPSHLFVGGIPSSQTDLFYAGTTWDGFKGQLEDVRVNGRAVDFAENLQSEAVVFGDRMEGTQGQNGCDFRFSGHSSYAEYDIGRFPDNFSLGFQLSAESGSGLLFYVFSRRRADKMAVQLSNSSLQLYLQDTGSESLVTLPQPFSLGEWHDVRIARLSGNLTITLDGGDLQEVVVLPHSLRTTSPLYIGGLPSDQRIPVSSGVVTDHYTGCLRTHYLSLASSRHGVEMNSPP